MVLIKPKINTIIQSSKLIHIFFGNKYVLSHVFHKIIKYSTKYLWICDI